MTSRTLPRCTRRSTLMRSSRSPGLCAQALLRLYQCQRQRRRCTALVERNPHFDEGLCLDDRPMLFSVPAGCVTTRSAGDPTTTRIRTRISAPRQRLPADLAAERSRPSPRPRPGSRPLPPRPLLRSLPWRRPHRRRPHLRCPRSRSSCSRPPARRPLRLPCLWNRARGLPCRSRFSRRVRNRILLPLSRSSARNQSKQAKTKRAVLAATRRTGRASQAGSNLSL